MNRIIAWIEETHKHVEKDFDSLVPIIGDEGMGKSTLILQLDWLWREEVGAEVSPEAAVGDIAWDLEGFKESIGTSPRKSCIHVHDAARVLSRKKAMHGDQIEVEEDLLDMRFGNYLVLLGYQEFDLVPTILASRRAKNLLRIPRRGIVHGHNEANIRKRYEDGDWPEPTFKDTFPDLEGKELWRQFKEEDQRRKQERISPDSDEETEKGVKEYAEQVLEDGIGAVVSVHGGHNKYYIDKDLIEVEYDVSGNKAKKIAKLLKKQVDLEQLMGAPQ